MPFSGSWRMRAALMADTTTFPWLPAGGSARALVGVYASVAASGVAWGTLVPLMPVLLDRQGFSVTAIGINAAMPVLAVLTVGLLIGPIIRRLGLNLALYGGIIVIVAALLLLSMPQSFLSGLALRYVIGLGGGLHWILSETWINRCAPPARRGFYIGIYAMLFMIGSVLGPLIVALLDLDGPMPFIVIAGFVSLSGLVMWLVRHDLPAVDPEPTQAPWQPLAMAPILFLGVLTAGLLDSALWSLFPVYALNMGSVATHALTLSAVLNAGTFSAQIILGLIADRLGSRRTLLVCAGTLTAACALLPFVYASWALWPILLVIGATSGGMYTMPMVEMGERFDGKMLTGANALFVMMYSFGGLVGPPVTGVAMDAGGAVALPVYATLIGAAFLSLAVPATLLSRPGQRTPHDLTP
jgi:MFS family permease